jgi:CIC family chloride channel protein
MQPRRRPPPGPARLASAWPAEHAPAGSRIIPARSKPRVSPFRGIGRQAERLQLHTVGRVLFLSSLVGVVAGLGAIVFQYLCQWVSHLVLDGVAGLRMEGPSGERALFHATSAAFRPWLIPLVTTAGGLVTGLIVQRFAPEAAGHGTDEAVDAFHRREGVIRGRVPIVKTIASAITLGSGGSGGREGPIAQIGAGFGSFLATRLGLGERDRRILLAAGVGAGVGSIFRAPLAGALFAAEVLYEDPEFEPDVIIPAAIATIVAYCVFSLKFGFGALFATPRFSFHSAAELLPYSLLAVIVAAASGLFVEVFYGIHALFQRLRIPKVLKPALGGLLTGLVGVLAYEILGDTRSLDVLSFGYGTIQHALHAELPLALLLVVAIGKMMTTGFSIGSGGSGGVFGPSMVIGGALGGAVGLLAQQWMPDVVTQPGAFVPVGMAGFFSAAANTPISTLVMVSEMTGNYELLLPALWVCSLSYLMGRRWTLYRSQVASRLESPAHRGAILASVLKTVHVHEVIGGRPLHQVPEAAPLRDVIQACMSSSQHCFPVVDGSLRMTGLITLAQIRQFLDEHDQSTAVIAHDLATRPKAVLSPQDDLERGLQLLMSLEVEELPVVDDNDRARVVGILSRRDIIAAYAGRRLEHAARTDGAGSPG